MPTSVPEHATIGELQQVAATSSHLRILVGGGADARAVHVRDTLDDLLREVLPGSAPSSRSEAPVGA